MLHYYLKIYFWIRTLHVSDGFSIQHQESSTVHTAIGICHTASSQYNLYDIYHCCVYNARLLMLDGEIVRNM